MRLVFINLWKRDDKNKEVGEARKYEAVDCVEKNLYI